MSRGDADRFLVNVAELLRRPASRLHVQERIPVEGVAVIDTRIPDGTFVEVDLELESMTDGIVATGHVRAPWEGECRRCLERAEGDLDVAVRELFQDPSRAVDEDAFALEGEQVDLVPLVRDALMLELPLAPVCRPDCAGLCPTCGVDLNQEPEGHHHEQLDPRWAALGDLRLDAADEG